MIDPNETPEDRRKHELLQCYRRGWSHGSGHKARDRRFLEHQRADIIDAYQRGYAHGEVASIRDAAAECERLQYDPRLSILRSASPATPPEGERPR